MRKRRKVLVVLGLIAVAVVCFVTLQPPDEPNYQGRYLSEWMAAYEAAANRLDSSANNPSSPALAELKEAESAVRAIGTNALPCFIQWFRYERKAWQRSLYPKLPPRLKGSNLISDWLGRGALRRISYGLDGMKLLGTNAVSAIPELKAMMSEPTKPLTAATAIEALGYIGEPAIPVLQSALADPKQLHRADTVRAISRLAYDGHSNACLPLLVQVLNDQHEEVRVTAASALEFLAPHLLTNVPAR